MKMIAYDSAGSAYDFSTVPETDLDKAIASVGGLSRIDRDGESYQVRVVTQDIDADLYDYDSAEFIRKATPAELAASVRAMITDGGRGVISVDGRGCYAL